MTRQQYLDQSLVRLQGRLGGKARKTKGLRCAKPQVVEGMYWLGRLLKEFFHFAPGVKLYLGHDRCNGDDGWEGEE